MDDYPESRYRDVFKLLRAHHDWFSESLPLIASENIPSLAVREALISDFGNRYAEGWPGERVYAGCRFIDQVELICIELAKKLFKAEFADVRPVSGVCANLAVYTAFSEPGDVMLALAIPNGGHISMGKRDFWGTAGKVHGLDVDYFEFDRDGMNVDVDRSIKKIEKMAEKGKPPRLATFGGSLFLFPHPVKELAETIHSVNGKVAYDAAHVSGLIAAGLFQDPLREGADAMMMSSHKTLFGPQGGAIMSFEKYAEDIKKATFPANTSNHHLHSVAAKAIAFSEMLRFGQEYCRQVVTNAKALAERLQEQGLHVLGEKRGFTESHQVAVDVSKYGLGGDVEKRLETANIIVNRQLLPGDIKAGRHYQNPGGIRLGTSEVTRLGMRESQMGQIAELISKVIVKNSTADSVRKEVAELRKEFQNLHYCFGSSQRAYQYIELARR